MTYRFKLQEPIAEGVRRIGLEQIDIAAAKLASKDDIAAAIHDARRCLKRLRALLRLVRPGLAEAAYRREAERLVGHRPAAVGRARSATSCSRRWPSWRAGSAPCRTARPSRLRKLLAQGHARSRRAGADGQAAGAAAPRAGKAPVHRQGRPAQSSSSTSSRGSRPPTARPARPSATPTRSPATRPSTPGARRCSCTGATCRCSRAAGRRRCRRAPSEAKELSRLLGEDHDYSVLLAFVGEQAASAPRAAGRRGAGRRSAEPARPSSGPRPGRAGRGCLPSGRTTSRSACSSTGPTPPAWRPWRGPRLSPRRPRRPQSGSGARLRRPPWARRRQSGVPGAGSPSAIQAPRPLFVKWARHKASHSHEPRTMGRGPVVGCRGNRLAGPGTLPVQRVPCSIGAAAARSCCRAE